MTTHDEINRLVTDFQSATGRAPFVLYVGITQLLDVKEQALAISGRWSGRYMGMEVRKLDDLHGYWCE